MIPYIDAKAMAAGIDGEYCHGLVSAMFGIWDKGELRFFLGVFWKDFAEVE
jgi:hypothetical protein